MTKPELYRDASRIEHMYVVLYRVKELSARISRADFCLSLTPI